MKKATEVKLLRLRLHSDKEQTLKGVTSGRRRRRKKRGKRGKEREKGKSRIQLQSHWQLQKLISTTYATIPANLTKPNKNATAKEEERKGEGENGRDCEEQGEMGRVWK